jgi:hypothetical protein
VALWSVQLSISKQLRSVASQYSSSSNRYLESFQPGDCQSLNMPCHKAKAATLCRTAVDVFHPVIPIVTYHHSQISVTPQACLASLNFPGPEICNSTGLDGLAWNQLGGTEVHTTYSWTGLTCHPPAVFLDGHVVSRLGCGRGACCLRLVLGLVLVRGLSRLPFSISRKSSVDIPLSSVLYRALPVMPFGSHHCESLEHRPV